MITFNWRNTIQWPEQDEGILTVSHNNEKARDAVIKSLLHGAISRNGVLHITCQTEDERWHINALAIESKKYDAAFIDSTIPACDNDGSPVADTFENITAKIDNAESTHKKRVPRLYFIRGIERLEEKTAYQYGMLLETYAKSTKKHIVIINTKKNREEI